MDTCEQCFSQNDYSDIPNLFEYATSELSQDAFLCWLFKWGKQKYRGKFLYRKAMALLKSFGIAITEETEIEEVKKQYKHIDILLFVKNPKKVVIIEDKISASEHDDQIKRYVASISDEGEYGEEEILTVYLKTANFTGKNQNADITMGRREVLDVLGEERSDNDIFNDFIKHLLNLKSETDKWKSEENIGKWTYCAWEGFLIECYSEKENAEMGYVPNPSGGFLGYWFDWKTVEENGKKELYKQIEIFPRKRLKLCYKINFYNKKLYDASFVKKKQEEVFQKCGAFKAGNRTGRTSTYAYKQIDLNKTSKEECIKAIDAFLNHI